MFVNVGTNTNKNVQSSTLDNRSSLFFLGGNNIKKSTSELLKSELSKMGYSKNAIKEIGKWLPLD
jgi:hypothetical protein